MSQISMPSMAHADPRVMPDASVKKGDSPEKIKDAAQQFEGLLLAQLLGSVHQDGGWLGSGDSSSAAATGFAEQQLAGMIAKNGGLGLSGKIAQGLQRQSATAHDASATPHAPSAKPPSRR
jgi:Rod binding domain-containing protein